jgi:hypothetical protein
MELLLPEGFLDRTRERGLVVMNWTPQMEVLQHDAVGAFGTHCGWNSALEGIVSGVPMICWPLYSEQRMNKVHMVEEMKVGVAVEGHEEELVRGEELEAKVKLVMEYEEGSSGGGWRDGQGDGRRRSQGRRIVCVRRVPERPLVLQLFFLPKLSISTIVYIYEAMQSMFRMARERKRDVFLERIERIECCNERIRE